ncbi:unnamed protein product [Psylliodes chrysocephalus]|uniref:Tetratricopeptide repeat protein 37 n=1 Tax=Psylliodes chrysocephalus TaxID=3402493 RepID=A0A9P0DDX5_9CUCU|nr:unnamed protein product [Psylliodes chrysocephala]
MEKAKLLLKEAREAIKNKDYERAMKYVQSVLKEDKYNYMALVFLGLCLQELGPVQQASKAFQKAAELNPKNPLAWNGLVNYYEKIQTEEANDKLVELYISALEVETNPKKITEYSEKLSKLHERGDITKITTTIFNSASKAENSAVEIFETLAKLYETVKQIPNELQPIFEECLCKLLSLREHMKVEYFSSYLNALYQQNKYLEVFETAEKMGNYYKKIGDSDKTRRCYEKSFNLNKSSPQVATELCNIYCKLKNWEGAQNLLLSLIEGPINEKNCWAWSQLGLTYLEQEDYSKAIEKLQFVVRIDKENTYYWQCLADAYFARGSYTSALKCYEKSLEFTENTLYPSLQKANIKKTLGIYNEANEEFKEILLNNEQYLPALKGLSETCICQAWECYRDQRLGTARDHAQSALKHLTLAVKERNNFSCLWKLIGDACLFVTNLPEKYCCLFVTDTLMEGKRIIEREDLFALATSSYCKAIGLTEDNVLIWHDLSNCYLKHALHTEDKEKRSMLFAYATAAAKHCSASNPKNWQHWNLLGNIVMSQDERNLALAQHYFIKAVTVENNNPISWCNLGILYLLMGDIKLANKAFAQGQRSDPNYVNNWIGQALIAETMGVEEAMDLFRHSVQLGHHQQGAIGYGHWVCQTLLEAPKKTISYSIEGMHAIPVACDALTWYTEKEEDNGCAWNMLGILKERMKLNKGSLEAFNNSFKLSSKHRDLARINYGRLLYKQEKYIPAVKVFQEVQEATFSSGSGLALALFKSQSYEDSYSAYEQALHWLTDEQTHQSELLVALASMAYMFQGVDGAKTLLFQSIQLKPPSPWGLYATLALALIHKDLELGELVLKELEPLKDNQDCLPHYATLLCTKLLRQENPALAVKELSKLVHRHPDNASVWLTLAVTVLRVKSERKRALAAVKCAQIALKIGQAKMDITKVLGYIALGYMLAGDLKNALVSAQKAVFCYPNLSDGWALLLSVLVKNEKKWSKDFISDMFAYVNDLNSSELLVNWLKKLRKGID